MHKTSLSTMQCDAVYDIQYICIPHLPTSHSGNRKEMFLLLVDFDLDGAVDEGQRACSIRLRVVTDRRSKGELAVLLGGPYRLLSRMTYDTLSNM